MIIQEPKRTIRTTPLILPEGKKKGIWHWNPSAILDDRLLNICSGNGITEIYMMWDKSISTDVWRRFIARAHERHMEVHALDGQPAWGLANQQFGGMDMIQSVADFNRAVSYPERFDAIHFDVESYLTDEWKAGPAGIKAVSVSWVANMTSFRDAAHAAGMRFGAAFPYWLEGVTDADPSVFPLYKAFMDIVDYYAIMSYSDSGPTVGEYVKEEIAYANSPKVMIGFELTQQEPPSITFFEEGLIPLDIAIESVLHLYETAKGFGGIALHSFDQWAGFLELVGSKQRKQALAAKTVKPAKTAGG